ncbi:hypothetical protein L2750_02900 [Shewanella submarina]|uniref:Uncharacterized protein n=1 Tax=Shewanella submarina TaxID=2016376 RepID=A0ABV7GFY0_9GAMM|nr:hypothetical protein [Shewanella submarina]MCL1036104.1 hypothetical protein [Shewanella submarina]
MTKTFGMGIAFVVGIGVGVICQWLSSYGEIEPVTGNNLPLEKVLNYANVQISDDNYACEGKRARTVGAVVASLVEFNARHSRNMLSLGCSEGICTLSYTDCKPSQIHECSSRILKFHTDTAGKIDRSTFSCIDLP